MHTKSDIVRFVILIDVSSVVCVKSLRSSECETQTNEDQSCHYTALKMKYFCLTDGAIVNNRYKKDWDKINKLISQKPNVFCFIFEKISFILNLKQVTLINSLTKKNMAERENGKPPKRRTLLRLKRRREDDEEPLLSFVFTFTKFYVFTITMCLSLLCGYLYCVFTCIICVYLYCLYHCFFFKFNFRAYKLRFIRNATFHWLVSLYNVRKSRAGHTLTMSVSPLFCHES